MLFLFKMKRLLTLTIFVVDFKTFRLMLNLNVVTRDFKAYAYFSGLAHVSLCRTCLFMVHEIIIS